MPRAKISKTSQTRVFLQEGGPSPFNRPSYMGFAQAGGLSYGQGGLSPVRVPSDERYGEFDTVDTIQGEADLPSIGVTFRMTRALSEVYRMARKRCIVGMQIHWGECQNASDFENGWDKVQVLSNSKITNYSTGDLGALTPDANAPVDENAEFTGEDWYELKRLIPSTVGAASITDEVIKVLIADKQTCGECGLPSDGCQVVFAVVSDTSGSPGLNARIMYSLDGGANWSHQVVNSMSASETPVDAAVVGPYLVIWSGGSNDRHHYALIADIVRGIGTWSAISTGYVAAGSPSKAYAHDVDTVWITGDGGYIYKSTDVTSSVTPKTSGDITAQNLKGVHSYDGENVIAVGASNVVLRSTNAGDTWSLQTGPVAGVVLNAVYMFGPEAWMIGAANGRVYATRNGGISYSEVGIPDAGSGSISDIAFSKPEVGYIGRTMTSSPRAQILRSINGGYSWRQAQGSETMPTGQTINSIAACPDDPNVVFGAGLGTDLSDGFLVKFS